MKNALIPYRPPATQIATQEDSNVGGIQKQKKSGIFWLRMRVPERYSHIDKRGEVTRSLKTGDKREAQRRAIIVEQQLIDEWDAKLAGRSTSGDVSHYEAIAKLSGAHGFSYRNIEDLIEGGNEEIFKRLDYLIQNGFEPGSVQQQALMGTVERPKMTVLEVAESMGEWYPEEYRDKNDRQKRQWTNRWKRVANKLQELLGYDPILEDITRESCVALRDTLRARVMNGSLVGSSAQKILQYGDLLYRKYFKHFGVDELDMPPSPFRGLSEGLARLDEEKRKDELPLDMIKELMKPGALDTLNSEARDIIYVLIETGCRQSEVHDLPASSIFLDEDIPFIEIKHETGENAREVKNKATRRKIPLVGVALEVMRRNPEGFPRYRGFASFSGAVNKQLRSIGILPKKGITIGGLRHSFETRLKNIGIPNDDRGELMGHSVKRARGREHYGDVMSLEKRLEILQKIELPYEKLALPAK